MLLLWRGGSGHHSLGGGVDQFPYGRLPVRTYIVEGQTLEYAASSDRDPDLDDNNNAPGIEEFEREVAGGCQDAEGSWKTRWQVPTRRNGEGETEAGAQDT